MSRISKYQKKKKERKKETLGTLVERKESPAAQLGGGTNDQLRQASIREAGPLGGRCMCTYVYVHIIEFVSGI